VSDNVTLYINFAVLAVVQHLKIRLNGQPIVYAIYIQHHKKSPLLIVCVCVCVCARACVCVCVSACVRACVCCYLLSSMLYHNCKLEISIKHAKAKLWKSASLQTQNQNKINKQRYKIQRVSHANDFKAT